MEEVQPPFENLQSATCSMIEKF